MKLKIYDLDVWGNSEDGFEVNNWWEIHSTKVDDFLTPKEATEYLKSVHILKDVAEYGLNVDSIIHADGLQLLDMSDGSPLLELVYED